MLLKASHFFPKHLYKSGLSFNTVWINSADDKLIIFFLFFPENRIWHFMQIVSLETICTISEPVFWEKAGKFQYAVCWELYPDWFVVSVSVGFQSFTHFLVVLYQKLQFVFIFIVYLCCKNLTQCFNINIQWKWRKKSDVLYKYLMKMKKKNYDV